MRHLESATSHRIKHLTVARNLYDRGYRWKLGAILVHEFEQLLEAKKTRNSSGFASLLRGGMVNTMWVLKAPACGKRRGDQVHNRALKEHMEAQGAAFRTIRYPRGEDERAALKSMAKVMGELHHPAQFGFVPKRDCVASAAVHSNARTVFLLDIEDAFNQVSRVEVEEILRQVFFVKGDYAYQMSVWFCGNGASLYQGNPVSPVLFNIRMLWLTERLQRLCAASGASLSVYADDITISHPSWEYFSASWQKTVYRVIRECGMRVNESKCKVRRVSPGKVGHYDITGLTIDWDEHTGLPYVRPLHRRRTLQKADYLGEIQSLGAVFSNEAAKDGSMKELACVEAGLRNWAQRQGKLAENDQLTLKLATA